MFHRFCRSSCFGHLSDHVAQVFAKAGPAQVRDQECDTVAPWSSFLVACFQTFPHLLVSYFCLQPLVFILSLIKKEKFYTASQNMGRQVNFFLSTLNWVVVT